MGTNAVPSGKRNKLGFYAEIQTIFWHMCSVS